MTATCMIYDQRLKGELQSLRRKGALFVGGQQQNESSTGVLAGSRSCSRCRGELGRIINRGATCPLCNQRVCKNCRQYGSSPTQWLCIVCHKHMELKNASGDWMSGWMSKKNGKNISPAETVKRSIQRSWTFSDVSPSPWSYLRGSPEMRAYSSMPRHQDIEYIRPPPSFAKSQDNKISTIATLVGTNHVDSATSPVDQLSETTHPPSTTTTAESTSCCSETLDSEQILQDGVTETDESTPTTIVNQCVESSPIVEKREVVESLTGTIFRKVTLRVDARNLPPGVTPPRSRRNILTSSEAHEEVLGEMMGSYADHKALAPDSDDYKLVFISSSDSSSREELHSDDNSSVSSCAAAGLLEECDWDYFECWPSSVSRREAPPEGSTPSIGAVDRAKQTESDSTDSCRVRLGQCVAIHVPIPVPFPFPVPVFVPVPVPAGAAMNCSRETNRRLPDSEVLPLDEAISKKAVSSVLVSEPEENNSVVLKVYKSLDTSDSVVSPSSEDILRLTEARLKDFTDFRDDNSLSSVSSTEDGEPSVRVYNLNDSDGSSSEFSLAASPPKSLTDSATSSCSSEEEDDCEKDSNKKGRKNFKRTFVLYESSGSGSASSDENSEITQINVENSSKREINKKEPLEMCKEIPDNAIEREPEKSDSSLFILSDDHSPCNEKTNELDSLGDTCGFALNINNKSDPHSGLLTCSDNEQISGSPSDKMVENILEENNSRTSDVINSIITFSREEVLQTVSEFLEEERKLYCVVRKPDSSVTEVDAALPETRSNTSDEFSGTESMEMPLEDSLEYKKGGGEGGHFRGVSGMVAASESGNSSSSSSSSARYTSLVMITQEAGGSSPPLPPPAISETQQPPADSSVTVVTGSNSNSTGVCLEEGLADDDSWVEELDRDEALTTTEESSEDEPYPDREEELRGYHRSAIDFTLHTIAEESCEESEVETEKNRQTDLEKYFFYGLGDSANNNEDKEDTMSETSSIYSEGVESTVSAGGVEEVSTSTDPAEMASSRLEKYFLSGFMGFNRRDSDGSVGSDSEGRPSPEQRRKRLVRARGTGRQHSSSLDNLVESTEQAELQVETEGSSTETDSHDEQAASSFDKGDGQFDTVKRTKKKKRSIPSTPSDLLEVPENYMGSCKEESADDGKKTPQPDLQQSDLLNARNKQQSRDSGFVGSCDDLLKESKDSNETAKTDESPALNDLKNNNYSETSSAPIPAAALIRKDSFNNWSSDEETNLMMSKMRAFFKTMVGTQSKGPNVKPKAKPPQLVYFESELTRLMKTVPGIRDEQVREIVEYLSSEDTWSDSYDSSDYTSSDLENSCKRSALQEEISASCRQIISNFESSANDDLSPSPEVGKDSALVYQRLVASFSKMEVPKNENVQNSPLLIEKVMQHIGSRLWALMHEVSGGESSSPKSGRYHKRLSSKLSVSTTEEEEDCVEGYSPLPRSKSHDPLLEETRQEASDNERFSWRGSFESALMASDSRTRLASGGESSASASALALAAKRRSAGDLMFKSCSREQLDRVRSCGSIGGSIEDKIWTREQKRRRNSIPDSGGSAGDDDSDVDETSAGSRATLPRSLQSSCASATNSLPRLPTTPSPTSGTPIYKSHSVHQFNAKSARYRPPGYRNSPLAPPPRRERNRRNHGASSGNGCDDSSICSEPSAKGPEEEVDRLLSPRISLGARSDSLASVYSGAGEGRHGGVAVKGEVQFGLQYNYKQSCLEIHVKQCKDLAPVDTKRSRSDPYVKVYLLPDKSKSGKRKTRVKKHTLNPVFDEVLRFQVSLDGLETRTLWLSVWHSDMFGRNDFLGEVLMPLENKVFDDPLPKFYALQERSEPLEELNSKGELIVGLKYETPDESNNKKKPSKGCLYVLIKEAKNLPPVKSNGSSDPFCKSYLLPDKGKGSKQKAPVIKRSCNPAWNHTFTYNNISMDELAERSLELTIWDHDRLASNEFLGGVRLNVGSGKYQGRIVDWMDSSGNEIALWQRMMEKPNFWVESCLALRPSLDLRRSLDLL